MISNYLLSLLIFLPMMAVPLILFLPAKAHKTIRWTTVIFTAIQLALTIYLLTIYNTKTADFQFVEKYSWIPAFNVEYHLGVDGLAILMVLLTPLICFVGIFASWGINKGVKGYFILYMILNTGMMGVFCSLDFF
ncbi:MAG: NADH-quinone oxidoreductase subunit M, partial [Planctomycetota bacterium]